MAEVISKHPNATKDYGFDWRKWLQYDEDLVSSLWTVTSGLTRLSDGIKDNCSIIWVTGGTTGNAYYMTNTIQTNQGRKEIRTIIVRVNNGLGL